MRRRIAFLAVPLACLAAGCGGSSHGSSSTVATGAATSRERFVSQAQAICGRLDGEFAADTPKRLTVAEIARLDPSRVAGEQRVLAELRRLVPPPSLERGVQEVIAARETLASELARLGLVAQRHDVAAIRELARSKELMHRKLTVAATSAGIPSCAKS
jgi:hypothetical protein